MSSYKCLRYSSTYIDGFVLLRQMRTNILSRRDPSCVLKHTGAWHRRQRPLRSGSQCEGVYTFNPRVDMAYMTCVPKIIMPWLDATTSIRRRTPGMRLVGRPAGSGASTTAGLRHPQENGRM